ncbi:MAG: tRNA (guanosine(46)-N7)-methyltransferase TrmB [Oligoflexia bacterium]|nr:tRNA (guanosine(46)-N7)-methyltransferase TrmB [Oligoflexia bacterium]
MSDKSPRGSRASSENATPVTDPAFRYAESRNIYAKKLLELKGKVYADHDTETHRGKWRGTFSGPNREALHLEIGCNAGHVVSQWAARDPKTAYIGLDWKYKPIFRGAEKGLKHGLENLIFFRAHAERVRFMFAENELDRVSIFFPDPWPKKKHFKNRWVTADRLRDLHSVLRTGGILHIKTDHPGYFDWINDALQETRALWEVMSHTRDLHGGNPDAKKLQIPDVTLFERLFINDGLPIHQVILKALK